MTQPFSKNSRPNSAKAYARAQPLMPGGVNSPARAFGAVGGEPLFIDRADGAYLWDVDGHRYVDYIGSWGPMILGHRFPPVVAALEEAISRGTSFGAPTEAESELAELIIECVPSVERVRLVNSGTEATMSAVRLARGFTGRDQVIKFAGNYHGHVDSLLVAAGSSAATLGQPNSPGVTAGAAKDTIVLPYNDPEALAAAVAEHGDRLAAVIFEPVCGNMGVVAPTDEFLTALRSETRRCGALLIADEVMTGFRLSLGGAQERLGVEPDLTTLGKIVGGGLPVGAYGGRSDVMAHVLPEGPVFQAGTLSGNPLATAAGTATLRALRDQPPYARLETLAGRLEFGLRSAAEAAGVPFTLKRVGSMLTLFFSKDAVTDWESASRCDTERFGRYFWAMLDRGVYLPCSQYEALFVSASHTEEDIDATIAAAEESLKSVA
ncbi:Glutamate-1-semialdehyde 2,1-aminomutase [Pseudobythopirellula maris]|uniref:Glutamate-1-semialdehyde 2,1-aminomutase n=1 Tax=Pseudobythopirellula maris TaxID=2527991 RepID=A0A5C5ZT62_9BACT|nr:glutamate-1-semialdehyde 2,1-aminomutase [Pseudobythopirellula maris]TWT90709.1 Glutamate-1-semialdehyde 2,1-aminomutase [Pseudobythopirellula maris]